MAESLSKYFDKRIRELALSSKDKKVDWDAWNDGKLILVTEFYPIDIGENYDIFIPTGTRSNPYGISRVYDAFILFVKKGEIYFSIHIDDLKDFMKNNQEDLIKSVDRRGNVGFTVNLSKLLKLRTL